MSYSFEYIDIILLAMIAGFIFLRLRGILGKRTGHEENMAASFAHESPPRKTTTILNKDNFDDAAKKEFLNGARIAYETIITSFSSGNLKDIKSLLGKKVLNEFNDALKKEVDLANLKNDLECEYLSTENTYFKERSEKRNFKI